MQGFIFKEAERLKTEYGTADPFELANALNIHLRFRQGLGALKGFYSVVFRERYIVINDSLNERDTLLVLGHELGHDRFHQQLAKVAPLKDFMLYNMASRAEYEANVFAAELLIADAAVAECIAEEMDYLKLCVSLGFQPQLMAFKLYSMMQRGYKLNLPEVPNGGFLKK